jgi:hypothetical protein
MRTDRHSLLQVQRDLEECAKRLDDANVPSGVSGNIRRAIERLKAHISMLDNWDNGSAWDR